MRITSKAPCRVDLAGGTLDIWPLYLNHPGAVTVNFAVNRYTTCVIETREDSEIRLRSLDLNTEEGFGSLAELRATPRPKLPLPAYVLRFFGATGGLSVDTHSEAPAGAGISGSSALIIAIASALNRLNGTRHEMEKLREIAQNIEAQIIRVPTGAQDYYPAMYGGMSAIELGPAGIRRTEIVVDNDDFNERIVLAYTGVPRESGINNWEVVKAYIDGDKRVHRNFERITEIACAMKRALEKQSWTEVGRLLREEWSHRKKNAPGISTPLIDELVEVTRRVGALGAKACGAGGGGCVFFLVERGTREKVGEAIELAGATVLPIKLATKGVRVEATRDAAYASPAASFSR
ncbi:MAG: GHMP kinase [Acidobacteriota bacterium]|nr:GHMP kinase [Acidobacteriota bacterium]